MRPVELEGPIGRELRRLPEPRAPHTLLPRVLAAVRAWSERPWYARAWFTWPLGWQVVTVVALMTLAAGVFIAVPAVQELAAARLSPAFAGVGAEGSRLLQNVGVASTVLRAIWHAMVEPLVGYAFVLVALMCAAIAALGVAFNRMAFGRMLQS